MEAKTMKNRTVLLASICVLVALVGGATIVIGQVFRSYSHRYKLTIAIDVDGVRHTGSSVVEVTWEKQSQILIPVPRFVSSTHGEAVTIDLGEGRLVFGILGTAEKDDPKTPSQYIALKAFGLDSDAGIPLIAKQKRIRKLEGNDIPMLVTFDDLNDLRSGKKLSPENLSATFGSGVKFVDASVEMTNDPVTQGIERKLPWWNGPFPWLKPLGSGAYIDTRTGSFRLNKENFQRSS
jgi:hypothetical protein